MYKHILIPTDGSALSDKAVDAAITLAKLLGARITAFHAMEPYPLQGAYAAEASGVAELQPELFAERSEEYAKRVLDAVGRAAAAANVQCTTAYASAHSPSHAIVERGRQGKVRSHRHGLARAARLRRISTGKRDPESSDPFLDPGAGLPLESPEPASVAKRVRAHVIGSHRFVRRRIEKPDLIHYATKSFAQRARLAVIKQTWTARTTS